MAKRTIHDDVQAALKRLDAEDPGLKRQLKRAYGYAVFPAVGKAALVIGGAYGRGEVYERGKVIGYATIAQTTIGVQVGGDTFTEVLVFDSKEPLERFKKGRTAFAANASAVLVKAGAAGTADFEKGVAAYAYSEGGMLLEAAIGGQRFHFQPADEQSESSDQSDSESDGEAEDENQEDGLLGKAGSGIKGAASKAGDLFKEHPLLASVIGTTVLAGGLLLMRAMRSGSSDDSDGQESDDSQDDEGQEQDDQPEDQAQDQDEESEDRDDDEESDDRDEDESPRFSRSRARH